MTPISTARTPVALAAALIAAAALAAAAHAQSQAPSNEAPAAETPTPPDPGAYDRTFQDAESWRARVAGKTLYYYYDSGLVGREYYPPSGDRVVFQYADSTCFEGTWTAREGVFCFRYDGVHCFTHHERDGQLIAREVDGDEQTVREITDEVLSCAPELSS